MYCAWQYADENVIQFPSGRYYELGEHYTEEELGEDTQEMPPPGFEWVVVMGGPRFEPMGTYYLQKWVNRHP